MHIYDVLCIIGNNAYVAMAMRDETIMDEDEENGIEKGVRKNIDF